MSCPYLKKSSEGMAPRYSCGMGMGAKHDIPEYCLYCSHNPEGIGDVDPRYRLRDNPKIFTEFPLNSNILEDST